MNDITFLIHTNNQEIQTGEDRSFIGGKPCLPPNISIPVTKETGNEMTFFFQLAFPNYHPWHGFTLALFSTTDFYRKGHSIPAMLDGDLHNIQIPKNFLSKYQKYFRYFVFRSDQGTFRAEYKEIIQFHRIEYKREPSTEEVIWGSISPRPQWILEDESPGFYSANIPMVFLFQTKFDYSYKKQKNAPRQTIFDNTTNSLGPSFSDDYDLFLGNECYYFGTAINERLVYILTQVD